jgi:hypothetical protein
MKSKRLNTRLFAKPLHQVLTMLERFAVILFTEEKFIKAKKNA